MEQNNSGHEPLFNMDGSLPDADESLSTADDPLADWLAPPGSTPPRGAAWLPILAIVASVALLVGGGLGLMKLRRHPAPGSGLPPEPTTVASPGSAWARDFPVATAADLDGVCRGWYYPQSPALTGSAPHPITVTVLDEVFKTRNQPSSIEVPDGTAKSLRAAWQPADLTKTQIVACVDFAAAGKSLGTCKFTTPKPTTVAFAEGVYKVTAYEVATGRKLLDVRLTGAEKDCPAAAIVPAEGEIVLHSSVTDRQLYSQLHALVER
ncbi:hypothetical protein HDA40_006078 [Hamadaea flava]|uniref:Uncharacterized protein n=1 Tax=Hamadaea flava TaxID=1742688 RepID=A0ABV8LVZ5_9ACTN|nr:hypothetical protein [Hamadaea flava]MCP2327571.1 hypothetical protein [Hamadaea flava]